MPAFDFGAALLHLQILGINPSTVRLRAIHWFKAEKDPLTHLHLKDPVTKKPLKPGPPVEKIGGGEAGLLARLEALQQRGFRVYFVVNRGGDDAPSITDCIALYVEWDDRPIEEQIEAWRGLGLPQPTLQVHTGGKSVHTYWKFAAPIKPDRWRNLTERLINHCASDRTIKDPSRVMALAGSTYWQKQTGNRQESGPDEGTIKGQAHILPGADPARVYDIEVFEQLLPPLPAPTAKGANRIVQVDPNRGTITTPADGKPPRCIEEIQQALGRLTPAVANNGEYAFWRDTAAALDIAVLQAGGTSQQALDMISDHSPEFAEAHAVIGRSWRTITERGFWAKAKAAGHKFWPHRKDKGYINPADIRKLPDPPSRNRTDTGGGEGGATGEQEPHAATSDLTERRRDDRPVELQAGDILYAVAQGNYAVHADTVHAYDPEQGIWVPHSDHAIAGEAQRVLRDLYVIKRNKETGAEWEARIHGSASEVRNTIASLRTTASRGFRLPDAPPPVIVFSNGTYDIESGRLYPHNPANGATYRVEAPFVSGADCPEELLRVISTCYPEGALEIIRTYIRWVIDPTVPYGQAFHFVGGSGTGKGIVIDLGQSLLPLSLVRGLGHPAVLENPEKVYQHALGARLICFPDCPVRLGRQGGLESFYELVENKAQSLRRLRAATGITVKLFARTVIGSIGPLQLGDAAGGFLRRILTFQTLPRQGDPDTSLRDDLIGNTPRHQQLRGELCAWALAMPLDDVNRVLGRGDAQGLLRTGADHAAKGSDTVTLFIDEALIPHPLGPDTPVSTEEINQMFEAYLGWCRASNVQYGMQRNNFHGALRAALGAKRCLERRTCRSAPSRNLPRLDAGFTLRPGILGAPHPTYSPFHVGDRSTFDRLKLGSGGIESIAELPQACRPGESPALSRQPCVSTDDESTQHGDSGDSPESPSLTQGQLRADTWL